MFRSSGCICINRNAATHAPYSTNRSTEIEVNTRSQEGYGDDATGVQKGQCSPCSQSKHHQVHLVIQMTVYPSSISLHPIADRFFLLDQTVEKLTSSSKEAQRSASLSTKLNISKFLIISFPKQTRNIFQLPWCAHFYFVPFQKRTHHSAQLADLLMVAETLEKSSRQQVQVKLLHPKLGNWQLQSFEIRK